MKTTLFFKTATTGLPLWKSPSEDPGQPWIVEIAADLVSGDGDLIERFDAIVRPGVPIPFETIEFHGITDEIAAAEGIEPVEMYERFSEMLRSAEQIAGWNVSFDIRMMRIMSAKITGFAWENILPVLCVMAEAAPHCKLLGARPRHPEDWKKPKLDEAVPMLLDRAISNDRGARSNLNQVREIYDRIMKVEA